jgi:ribose transport system permease protein
LPVAIVIISGGVDLSPGAVIALASVVSGRLFVEGGCSIWASLAAGLLVGVGSGLFTAALAVLAGLPPFIATLGTMGIARGTAFIVTEGSFFDVSGSLRSGWRPLGVPLEWLAPLVMVALGAVFHFLMHGFEWGRGVYAVGGKETAAHYSGIPVGAMKTLVYLLVGVLAAIAGLVLVQGKADLPPATSWTSSPRRWWAEPASREAGARSSARCWGRSSSACSATRCPRSPAPPSTTGSSWGWS